jgi:predicted O-methyltransferase YrrM
MVSKTDGVLRSIERSSWRRYFPIIGPEKGKILADVIHEAKPTRILEIGTLVGYSTITMAKELESCAEIITVEIDEDEAELAKENIRKAEVKPSVRVLVGDALDIIPKLEGIFDMIFIDAEKSEYFDYLRLLETRTHIGSVIIADNTDMSTSSMRKYLDYVRNSGRYKSKPVRWGEMEVSVKII